MKLILLLFTLLLSSNAFAQTPNVQLIDASRKITCGFLESRFDAFIQYIPKDSDMNPFLVFRSTNPGRDKFLTRAFQRKMASRGYNKRFTLTVLINYSKDAPWMAMYLAKPGHQPEGVDISEELKAGSIFMRTNLVDEQKTGYPSMFWDVSCFIHYPPLMELKSLLEKKTELRAHFDVKAKTRKRTKRSIRYLKKLLNEKEGIPLDRIRFKGWVGENDEKFSDYADIRVVLVE